MVESGSGNRLAELLTTEELADWLKVSPRTVRRWARDNEIPCLVMCGQWRFDRSAVTDWLQPSEVPE